METVLLFRPELDLEGEMEVAKKYFQVYTNRATIPKDCTVIGRYSVLPYYNELEKDLTCLGSKLVNTYREHSFIADITQWYPYLEGLTPKTWTSAYEIPFEEQGPFVIKGKTNSRKHSWNKRMYAETRGDIGRIMSSLYDDCLIAEQGTVIRKYEPFDIILRGMNDLPITHEFRIFVYGQTIIDDGFYWSSHLDEIASKLGDVPSLEDYNYKNVYSTIMEAIGCLSKFSNSMFYTLDVAKMGEEWRVVEINDGQMSGLSCIDPESFYSKLSNLVI